MVRVKLTVGMSSMQYKAITDTYIRNVIITDTYTRNVIMTVATHHPYIQTLRNTGIAHWAAMKMHLWSPQINTYTNVWIIRTLVFNSVCI